MSMGEYVSNFLTKAEIVKMKQEVMGLLEDKSNNVFPLTQIKQCFPIDDPIIKSLGFLNPDTVHSTKT